MFDNIIYAYTREMAIADGVLVDVSEMAREAGFKYPVAVTARVWHEVVVPDEEARKFGQSKEGRLWDVLWMARLAAQKGGGPEIKFQLLVADGDNKTRTITLKALCHPGDNLEPVVTVMFPDED